ncbi:uncharacterized protein METZ01_LOCUS228550 [marine metagenome]|uniref:Uncharacterized protein n=1 Tax=marine metagenome TaxID=408172 RepID=A0A382GKK3_9ZZZZ
MNNNEHITLVDVREKMERVGFCNKS